MDAFMRSLMPANLPEAAQALVQQQQDIAQAVQDIRGAVVGQSPRPDPYAERYRIPNYADGDYYPGVFAVSQKMNLCGLLVSAEGSGYVALRVGSTQAFGCYLYQYRPLWLSFDKTQQVVIARGLEVSLEVEAPGLEVTIAWAWMIPQ